MADIRLTGLFNQKQRQFGTQGTGSDRFKSDFVDACNRAIQQINLLADLASSVELVSNTEDIVTNLDSKYEYVLSHGITAELMLGGRQSSRGLEIRLSDAQAAFKNGIADIYADIINDQQNADTDDDTYDIIGLGALG